MSFNIDRFGSDASNVKSILGGVCYYRYFNKDNNDVTVAGYFPASLGLQLGDRIKVIPATKTDADEEYIVSDITNRVVTVTKVEAGGAVDSVNGKTGAVVRCYRCWCSDTNYNNNNISFHRLVFT